MRENKRRWIAEQYDQRGTMGQPHVRSHQPGVISFTNINDKETAALTSTLEAAGIHTATYKKSGGTETPVIKVQRHKDIMILCVYIYPYLKTEWKRERIVEVWREAGWCICEQAEKDKRTETKRQ